MIGKVGFVGDLLKEIIERKSERGSVMKRKNTSVSEFSATMFYEQ